MKLKKLISIIMLIILFSSNAVFAENPASSQENLPSEESTTTEIGADELTLLHNLAANYKNVDLKDINLPWIIADMITYETLFPESENILSEDQKDAMAKTIAKSICEAKKPGDLAKYIIALRALGYDARNIYTDDFKYVDAVKKLTDLIDSEDKSVKDIYTISYVLIALSQDESFATKDQLDWLIKSIIDSKDKWQSTTDGTDAMTPMLFALAPYSEDEIKALCNDTVKDFLKPEQREDGLIDGYPGCEPAATALAIWALSSLGIDSYEIKNGGKNLLEGLLSVATPELDAFPDEFATEQGFRALLSLLLLQENDGKIIYDFSDYPINELNIPKVEYCPVIFKATPADATVTIDGVEKTSKTHYDLPEGTYNYSISASGYEDTTGEIVIEAEDSKNHTLKTITASLSESYSGGARPRPIIKDKDTEKTEQDNVKEDTPSVMPEESETKDEVKEFSEDTFPDVSAGDWYYDAVKYSYQRGLFTGTDKGFEPNLPMTRAMLITVLHRLDSPIDSSDTHSFSDVPEDAWFSKSIGWAAGNNLITGISENLFAPYSNITREQCAVILYRYALSKGYDVSRKDKEILDFSDKDSISPYAEDAVLYAVSTGIINGKADQTLALTEKITRAEVAAILMRLSGVVK